MQNLGKQSGSTDASINNRIREMKERISGVEDMRAVIDHWSKKMLNPTNS